MAELTGIAEIDLLIERFQRDGHEELGDGEQMAAWLTQPWEAEGECAFVSCLFADYLVANGIRAYGSGRRVKAADYPFPRNPLLGSEHGPDDFGYQDRLRESSHPEHAVTIVEWESGEIFMIDWTASQFGYVEFPLVQRRDGNRWQRSW